MKKTLKELCQEVISVQNASNLSGVVHSFSQAMTNLRELFPDEETAFFNTHPIAVMYASKIESLTHLDRGFDKAYVYCQNESQDE